MLNRKLPSGWTSSSIVTVTDRPSEMIETMPCGASQGAGAGASIVSGLWSGATAYRQDRSDACAGHARARIVIAAMPHSNDLVLAFISRPPCLIVLLVDDVTAGCPRRRRHPARA